MDKLTNREQLLEEQRELRRTLEEATRLVRDTKRKEAAETAPAARPSPVSPAPKPASPKTPEVKEPEAIEPIEENPPEMSEEETGDFIKELNLESLLPPSFEGLSDAQKLKVAVDLKKRIVDLVKSEAQTQYSKNSQKKAASVKGIKAIGTAVKNSFTKERDLKNLEAELFTELKNTEGGREIIKKDLELLTERTKGREAYISRAGNPGFYYLDESERGIVGEKAFLNFTVAANNFAQLPYEWGQEKKGGNKKKYEKAKEEYEKSRNEILNAKAARSGGEKAATDVAEIDNALRMEQLINTHPEFEAALAGFDQSAEGLEWKRNFKKFFSSSSTSKENIAIGIGGAGIRALVKCTPFLAGGVFFAAPIIGGVTGALRGRIRAKNTLEERQKAARYGQQDESKEANKTVSAENMSLHLEKILTELEGTPTDKKKEALLKRLKIRTDVAKIKMEQGLMNFGDARVTLENQFNLATNFNKALVVLEGNNKKAKDEIEERVSKLISFRSEQISDAQKSFVRKQAMKSAAMGAGFATIGYTIKWLFEHCDVAPQHPTAIPKLHTETPQPEEPETPQHVAPRPRTVPRIRPRPRVEIPRQPEPERIPEPTHIEPFAPDEPKEIPKEFNPLDLPKIQRTVPVINPNPVGHPVDTSAGSNYVYHTNPNHINPETAKMPDSGSITTSQGHINGPHIGDIDNPNNPAHLTPDSQPQPDGTVLDHLENGDTQTRIENGITSVYAKDGSLIEKRFPGLNNLRIYMIAEDGHTDKLTAEGVTEIYNKDGSLFEQIFPNGDVKNFNPDGTLEHLSKHLSNGVNEDWRGDGTLVRRSFPNGILEHYDESGKLAQVYGTDNELIPLEGYKSPEVETFIQRGDLNADSVDTTSHVPTQEEIRARIEAQYAAHPPVSHIVTSEGRAGGEIVGQNTVYNTYPDRPQMGNLSSNIAAGKREHFPGIGEKENYLLQTHPKFVQNNPFHLTGEKLIQTYDVHNKNIAHIFPGNKIEEWQEVRDLKAGSLLSAKDYDEKDPMMNYLHRLYETTKLKPQNRIFRKDETVEEYIARALQKAAKMGELEKFKK